MFRQTNLETDDPHGQIWTRKITVHQLRYLMSHLAHTGSGVKGGFKETKKLSAKGSSLPSLFFAVDPKVKTYMKRQKKKKRKKCI